MCFLGIIVHSIYRPSTTRVFLSKKYNIIYLMLFSLGLGSVLSLIRSFNPIESFGYFLQYSFIFLIVLPIIVYLVESKKNIIEILTVYVLAAVPALFLVFLSSIDVFNSFDTVIRAGGGRYVGFNNIATSFGLYMCFICIISIILMVYCRKKVTKVFFLVTLLLSFYCVILSISFSAMILLSVGLSLIGIIFMKRSIALKIIFVFGMLLLTVVLLFFYFDKIPLNYYNYLPEVVVSRLENNNGEVGSSNLRMELNKKAINEFINSPLIGVGENQFRYYNYENRNVHNTILSGAVETGLFGLIGTIIYVLLPIIWWRKVYQFLKSKDFLSSKSKFLLQGLLILAIMRVSQTAFSGPYIQREAWIPILLILAIYINLLTFKRGD